MVAADRQERYGKVRHFLFKKAHIGSGNIVKNISAESQGIAVCAGMAHQIPEMVCGTALLGFGAGLVILPGKVFPALFPARNAIFRPFPLFRGTKIIVHAQVAVRKMIEDLFADTGYCNPVTADHDAAGEQGVLAVFHDFSLQICSFLQFTTGETGAQGIFAGGLLNLSADTIVAEKGRGIPDVYVHPLLFRGCGYRRNPRN